MRPKIVCEVCGLNNVKILHRHHIIPRQDNRSTNKDGNIAILCPTDHARVHAGEIIILGVYGSTTGPVLIWHYKDQPPPVSKDFWLVKDNPLVAGERNGRSK